MDKNYWQNKRVLITGSEGFVGSAFFKELQKNKVKIVGTVFNQPKNEAKNKTGNKVVLDVLNKERLALICRNKKINLIIHCAALDGNSEFKAKNAARIIEENIKMVLNILNVAQEQKITELVILSSAEIYAGGAKSPIKEEDDYTKTFPSPANAYVMTKISMEILAGLYAQQFNLKIMLPRPTNVYGPGDKINPKSSRVISNLIQKILSNQEIEIWGDGSQIRSFIYITDLVKSIIKMVESGRFNVLNIATREAISITDLAKLIAKLAFKKVKIRYLKTKASGVKERILDVRKLNSLIDFKFLSLQEGLAETIAEHQKALD